MELRCTTFVYNVHSTYSLLPIHADFLLITSMCRKFVHEASNVVLSKSSVAAMVDSVCLYYPPVILPSHCIDMDIQKQGNFSHR